MIAAGMYLRTLREKRDLSRVDVAAQLKTNEMQIIRVEKGEVDTRSSFLMKFLDLVSGDAGHLARLILDEDADAEEGIELALKWLSKDDIEELSQIPVERSNEVLALLDKLERQDQTMRDAAIRALHAFLGQ